MLVHDSNLRDNSKGFNELLRLAELGQISSSLIQIDESKYLMHYMGWLLLIDAEYGRTYKYKVRFKTGIKRINAYKNGIIVVIESDDARKLIATDSNLSKNWVIPAYSCSKINKYRVIDLGVNKETNRRIAFKEHHLIALCIWGFEAIKCCINCDSYWTVDHKDGDKLNNKISNLRIISRADNTRVARITSFQPVEWGS